MAAWHRVRAKPPWHRLLQRCTTGPYHSFASYLDPYQTTPSPGLDAARPPTTMSRSIPLNRNCLGLPSVVHVPLLIPTAICVPEPIRAKTAEPDRSVQTSQCDSKTWRCNPVGAGRPAAVKTIFIDGRREDVRVWANTSRSAVDSFCLATHTSLMATGSQHQTSGAAATSLTHRAPPPHAGAEANPAQTDETALPQQFCGCGWV